MYTTSFSSNNYMQVRYVRVIELGYKNLPSMTENRFEHTKNRIPDYINTSHFDSSNKEAIIISKLIVKILYSPSSNVMNSFDLFVNVPVPFSVAAATFHL